MRTVYLDHAATTPLDERVLEEMLPYLKNQFGNASSVHALGRKARFAVEESREKIADLIGAAPGEIVFTSGGTEADNTALKGAVGALPAGKNRIVTSKTEHKAVLQPAKALKAAGVPVSVLPTNTYGVLEPKRVEKELAKEVGLVSLMHVNNELGTVTAVEEISRRCREQGVLMHCDAVQSAGLFAIDVNQLGVDLLSISGHKFYGPKGVGVLYVRGGLDMLPLVEGGGQERKRRGGTENVAGVVGMARAFELAVQERKARKGHLQTLQKRLIQHLEEAFDGGWVLNTPWGPDEAAEAAPHVVNIAFSPTDNKPVDGEMLLLNLDMKGVCVSSGSACTSGAVEPSHVLQAVGLEPKTAAAAVRFSLGKDNTAEEIDYAVEALKTIVTRMRSR